MVNIELKPEVFPNDSNEEHQPDYVNTVFGIPELREMIISRAIYTSERKRPVPCRKTIPSLRLMSKDWLAAVSKILRKDKMPLFHLVVNKKNSVNGTPYVQNEGGKLLDIFVQRVYSAPWNQENKPTIILDIKKSFFRAENYNSLLNFLLKCGESLVVLKLWIPLNGGSLPCIFPTFSLASLQDIVVYDQTDETIETQFGENERLVGNSLNITSLLNSLLNASASLDQLALPTVDGSLPEGFPMITLPATVTKLQLDCELTNEDLKILIRNRLPNLSYLSLAVSVIPFSDEVIFQVLEKYKKTLESLLLSGIYYVSRRRREAFTLIRFPEMKKLRELKFYGVNYQLEPEVAPPQVNLPALKHLTLFQNEAGFRKWTEFEFSEVDIISFKLIKDQTSPDIEDTMPIKLENMQLLHQTFPNIHCLKLTMLGDYTCCGIKYVFMELKQLRTLSLKIVGADTDENSDYWDALFTGVTVELIAGLRQSPDFWETVSLDKVSKPSLRMLTGLERFQIFTLEDSSFTTSRRPKPLMSDLTFIHAFLKMPRLSELSLIGRFKASTKITNIWKSKGKRFW